MNTLLVFVIGLLLGTGVGIGLIALANVNSYEDGYRDAISQMKMKFDRRREDEEQNHRPQ